MCGRVITSQGEETIRKRERNCSDDISSSRSLLNKIRLLATAAAVTIPCVSPSAFLLFQTSNS
jgi:hypothetical protein